MPPEPVTTEKGIPDPGPTEWGAEQQHAREIFDPKIVEAVERALLSYGPFREWNAAAQHNLLMSICGSLSYVAIPASSVAELRRVLGTIRDGTAPPAKTERESMDTPALPRATIHKLARSALHPIEENE